MLVFLGQLLHQRGSCGVAGEGRELGGPSGPFLNGVVAFHHLRLFCVMRSGR